MSTRNRPVDWAAAVWAGMAAGVVATIVQIVLWSVFTNASPTVLFRDARFAAAIVLGPGVLPPPASFDGRVVLVATLVHFALSVVYGLILSRVIAHLRASASLFVGVVFGLCLYTVNMHGFTIIFPWFEASRVGITIAAQVAFGVIAAGAYRILSHRHRARRRDAD
jgi:hypothetical protein